MRRVVLAIAGLFVCLPPLTAQQGPPSIPSLAFDAASIKENTSSEQGRTSGPTPSRYVITNIPLKFILLETFGVRDHQLVNVPDWTWDVRYDIQATYPPGLTPTLDNTREMMRTLLADRFRLVTHRETRELPMYALVMSRRDGRLGPQIAPSSVDCAEWFAEKRPQINAGSPSVVAPAGRRHACMMMASRRLLYGGTQTLQQLATALQGLVGRPVLDRTGLPGTFDIDLKWDTEPTERPAAGGLPPADVAAILTAVQDQLGLKLEASRGPFDVIVIDAIQRPTPD